MRCLPSTRSPRPRSEVLHLWTGLGYQPRTHLHKTAKRVVTEYGGIFPADVDKLAELPG